MRIYEEELRSEGRPPQRTSRRQPNCILAIGSQRLPAVIDEERGGTMHVLVQGNPRFWVDDTGLLVTPNLEISVCVFNIVRREGAEDKATDDIPTFRVGLNRLGEIDRQPNADLLRLMESDFGGTESKAKGSPFLRLLVMLALAVVATAGVLAIAVWQGHVRLPFLVGSRLSSADRANNSSGFMSNPEDRPNSPVTPAPQRRLAKPLQLPGVEPLLQPEVAKKLELTPDQTDACRRLHRITQEAVEDLEKYWGSDGRWEFAQKQSVIQDEARRHALLLLTEPQRKLWEELTR